MDALQRLLCTTLPGLSGPSYAIEYVKVEDDLQKYHKDTKRNRKDQLPPEIADFVIRSRKHMTACLLKITLVIFSFFLNTNPLLLFLQFITVLGSLIEIGLISSIEGKHRAEIVKNPIPFIATPWFPFFSSL